MIQYYNNITLAGAILHDEYFYSWYIKYTFTWNVWIQEFYL